MHGYACALCTRTVILLRLTQLGTDRVSTRRLRCREHSSQKSIERNRGWVLACSSSESRYEESAEVAGDFREPKQSSGSVMLIQG